MQNFESAEQARTFKHLEYSIKLNCLYDFNMKLSNVQYICGTVKRKLGGRGRIDNFIKVYEVMTVPTLLLDQECWTLINRTAEIWFVKNCF